MADRLSIRVKGIKAARKKMGDLKRNLQDEVFQDLSIQVKQVEREAKRIAPRDTGNLLRTISSEVEVLATKIQGLVGVNVKYALPLEVPESRDPRHRSRKGFIGRKTAFLLPALARNTSAIVSGIKKAVKRAVNKT